jgi:MFS family permease
MTDLAPAQSRTLGLRRIGGTLIGAALGALLGAILEPHPWSIALSIIAAMSVSNLLRAEEGARLAGFTSAVVLLSPEGGAAPLPRNRSRHLGCVGGQSRTPAVRGERAGAWRSFRVIGMARARSRSRLVDDRQ